MVSNPKTLARQLARAVGAGAIAALETVDFNDPNRPRTCLEVDFPILPINQIATLEGNSGKPIYQMSKWWARRRSSVFRSMLIAAATRAPEDPSHAAKRVWDHYYANHQAGGAFAHLKVADIFMGGGTTLIEGSRLGMRMYGNDLNPIAWFVVKQELAHVNPDAVTRLLADVETEVKPQIIPYYSCDGPNGEKGQWTHTPTARRMPPDFDPLTLSPQERGDYRYDGPELIYTFWAKHGPCQVAGCGHRTPILRKPVIAIKTLSIKHWAHTCSRCDCQFHIEERAARMAPDVPLYVAPSEPAFSVLDKTRGTVCPRCGHAEPVKLGRGNAKKVQLALLVHPAWMAGSARHDDSGQPFGGSAQDDARSTARWNQERAAKIRLLEVRGALPDRVTCPETHLTFKTDAGTVARKSTYTCGACGTAQDVLQTVKASGKTGPLAAYAIQGYAPGRDRDGAPYGGRFFAPFDSRHARQYDAAAQEWEARKNGDLAGYWPRSEVPFGFMTHQNNGGIPNHGYTHWWTLFNPRQLLVHAQLLRAIQTVGDHDWSVREFVLGAFQQYLRNQNLFCIWDTAYDKLVPHLSNNNYHPKAHVVENCVFSSLGRGNWTSCAEGILKGRDWALQPWETASVEGLKRGAPLLAAALTGKSGKVCTGDPVRAAHIFQGSSTELQQYDTAAFDLVVTDPPFGGLLHYSELADFFYVWLRLALHARYPDNFGPEYTPKSLEAVANRAREPKDPNGLYQRLLTQCWREAHRILKPGGILTFTFHHGQDKPWETVLESLFDAGFYLEATFPIRSDETKGEGARPGTFGSQTIEYDIIHVCRKRTAAPQPVSWSRLRREVLAEVHQLRRLLENHARDGLPPADLQLICRGKALEYFSRHYGRVYIDENKPIGVRHALLGINQLIAEGAHPTREPPPANAEPVTRQFLQIFNAAATIARDQLQKFLRGTGMTPDEFVHRGWCREEHKIFNLVKPLDFCRDWHNRPRKLTCDLDQALVLIGACIDGSGINASDTLKSENFTPHAALKRLLEWLSRRGADLQTRSAASRALAIYNAWALSHPAQVRQMTVFFDEAAA